MKKSIYSKWHVKLALALLCAIAIYLTVGAFRKGYKEGTEPITTSKGGDSSSPLQ